MSLNLGNKNIDGLTTLENLTSIRTFIGKGDFNNDGWDDIISYDTNLFILINNQDTTFTKIDVAQQIHGVDTEVAVMNNDRKEDIIVATDGTLYVFSNQTNLSFTEEIILMPLPSEHYTIEIADLYNDGFPEIIEGAFPFYVYNNNNGKIVYDSIASNPNTPDAVFAVATGDVNHDGHINIVTSSACLNELL